MDKRKIRRHNLDDHFFDVIDTEAKAYIFGLLYTDGTNYCDNNTKIIKLDAAEDSKDILDIIKQELNYDGEIHRYDGSMKTIDGKSFMTQPSYRISLSSKHMSEVLRDKGFGSSKTYREFPKDGIIPEELLRHFFRGMYDGDGSIGCWIDNEKTRHKKFNLQLCCTTDIVKHVGEYFKEHFDCTPTYTDRREDSDNNNLTVAVCGNRVIQKILDWMYVDANYYMKRKQEKYKELLEQNERVNNDTKVYGSAKQPKKVIRLDTEQVFHSMGAAARDAGVHSSTIYSKIKKNQGYMYYNDYLTMQNKAV